MYMYTIKNTHTHVHGHTCTCSTCHTFVLLIAVEVKDALHKVLKEDGRLPHKKKMNKTELSELTQLLVNKSADKAKKERASPLDVVLLKEACQ